MKVCAGIVLYNPDVERLKRNINAIKPQVDLLVFVDNASGNVDEVENSFLGDRYVWIKNEENLGISGALNQLIEYADNNGYEWILTLDQDSICGENFVEKLLAVAVEDSKTAMVGPLIIDRGIADRGTFDAGLSSENPLPDSEDVKLIITSGALTNVEAVLDVGGFNNWLFIDEVDREICLRLLRKGYRLVRVNTIELNHEYGLKTVTRRVLWKKTVYRNYTPFRVYYQNRNLVYMMRKYGREYTPRLVYRWVRLFFAFFVKFINEPDRIPRLKAFSKGIKDGFAVDIKEV